MEKSYRIEKDLLGEMEIPKEALHGVHTARAVKNFPLSGRSVHAALVSAYGTVKLACAITNRALGIWPDKAKADAIEHACRDMVDGRLNDRIVVDSLQGGGWHFDQHECERSSGQPGARNPG